MSRKYEIEWPQTDDLRFVIREWWTLDGENPDEWVKRPLTVIISGQDELLQWLKDNWEIEP